MNVQRRWGFTDYLAQLVTRSPRERAQPNHIFDLEHRELVLVKEVRQKERGQ